MKQRILSEELARDIARSFHYALRQEFLNPEEAKELAQFLLALSHLAHEEGQAGYTPLELPAALTSDSPSDVIAYAVVLNEERGYGVDSPLLSTPQQRLL
jgi:hypothetical protein